MAENETIQGNKENVTLIWFDSTTTSTEDIEQTIKDFRTLNDCVFFSNEMNRCIDLIKSINTEKIFLIISANNAYILLPTILHLSQLDSIFIFPGNRDHCNRLFDDFYKIINIFNDLDELKVSIKDNIKHLNKQIQLFSFYDFHQQSLRDMSTQSPEFLWFQLFKDVISCLSDNDKAKEDMLSACRQYYRGNYRILQMIDEFEKDYHADDCIRWYTRETFVYQLINKALRTEDIEQLYMFRFYITDLSKKLATEHKKMKNQSEEMISLYRGTIITKNETEVIEINQGKLIATNCYWSASRDRSYAITFAKKRIHRPDMIPVLFQIKCHLNDENNSIIFADISNFSLFPEEQEFLFDLGAIFTIEQIHEETIDDTHLLIITIKTNGEGREISKKYLENNRQEMEFESPTILFCNLLKRMGKFQQSFHFLQYLMKNPGSENLAHIHNRIGIALKDDGKHHLAFEHFETALQLTLSSDLSQQKYLPVILLNQGLLHAKMKQYPQALLLYEQTQELLKNNFYSNPYVLTHLYNSIGRVYSHQGDFNTALHYYFKASLIREEVLPPGHEFIALGCIDIAHIYSRQSNHDQALKYHLQALNMRKKGLPANHHSIAWSLHQVGKLYQQMGDLQLALQCYLESLEINRQCQSNFLLISILHLLDDIVSIYDDQTDLSLQYQLEALDVQRKIEPIDYFLLANRLDTIASTYKSIKNANDSLNYYKQALEIRQKYLTNNSRNLARSFHNLASIYDKMGNKKDALTFYKKQMRIVEDIYSSNHWLYQRTRTNVERIERLIK